MLTTTGLTREKYFHWIKHRFMPPDLVPLNVGRGNRRRYHIAQLAALTGARALADAGVPNRDALLLARKIGMRVVGMLAECRDLAPAAAVEKLRDEPHPWVAVFPIPRGAKLAVLIDGAATENFAFMSLLENDDQASIREFMRANRLVSITILDVVALAVSILQGAIKVVASRGRNTPRRTNQ
jgi:hypothetical protein